MIYQKTADGEGYILDRVDHPTAPHTRGNLIWYPKTGLFAMLVNDTIVSVPQDWAADIPFALDRVVLGIPGEESANRIKAKERERKERGKPCE